METARDAIDNNPCVANCRLRKRRISRIHISPVGHIESCVRLNNAPVSTRSVDRFPLPDDDHRVNSDTLYQDLERIAGIVPTNRGAARPRLPSGMHDMRFCETVDTSTSGRHRK